MKTRGKREASSLSSGKSRRKTRTKKTLLTGSRSPRPSGLKPSTKSGSNTTFSGMVLTDDYREFIESLNVHEVHYLIVGGYAVGHYGHPRYTKDMDVWLWMNRINAERTVKALEHFGFGSLGLKVEDFLSKDDVIQLGYEPDTIDLITSLENISFEECFQRRQVVSWRGTHINVIGLEDLICSKQSTGRLQDLADEHLGRGLPRPRGKNRA